MVMRTYSGVFYFHLLHCSTVGILDASHSLSMMTFPVAIDWHQVTLSLIAEWTRSAADFNLSLSHQLKQCCVIIISGVTQLLMLSNYSFCYSIQTLNALNQSSPWFIILKKNRRNYIFK